MERLSALGRKCSTMREPWRSLHVPPPNGRQPSSGIGPWTWLSTPNGTNTRLHIRNGTEHGKFLYGGSLLDGWSIHLVAQPDIHLHIIPDSCSSGRGWMFLGNSTFPLSYASTPEASSIPGTRGPQLSSNLGTRPRWPSLLRGGK